MKYLNFEMNESKANSNDVNNNVSKPAPLPAGSGPWPVPGAGVGLEVNSHLLAAGAAGPRLESCKENVGESSQEKEPSLSEMGLKSVRFPF